MGFLKRLFGKDNALQGEKGGAVLPPSDREDTKHNSQIVVGIPGPWESEQDLVKSLLESNEGEFTLLGTATRFTNAFLRAGGIAVNVESAGVAHPKNTWLEKAAKLETKSRRHRRIFLTGCMLKMAS